MENQPLQVELSEGMVVTIVGLLLVFLTLAVLFLFFNYAMPVIRRNIDAKKNQKAAAAPIAQVEKVENDATGEVNAVIAAAIHHYLEEAHDDENTMLTIQKVKKAYSPWSSKIYTVHGGMLHR
ncbi:OadG family protein [Flammeovirga yaeyamensis]|uniref:OadG family protein n=1 Tax=Flammeovirga yaeyamensis TaxID=367791 RepID=A0AAX1MYR9_9BACT|nr:OadG family protein [Flammeovirga yaeyamensis]MBB3696216.1 sodium pump decarboxylase gamma subunit [Flammeovirga yaeyamensis]NMF34897.1 OadG family protein [Flammeovirga yaeyamensis]QWG00276.1 OadG family protein [Flammeovirga yaeyamensis]